MIGSIEVVLFTRVGLQIVEFVPIGAETVYRIPVFLPKVFIPMTSNGHVKWAMFESAVSAAECFQDDVLSISDRPFGCGAALPVWRWIDAGEI